MTLKGSAVHPYLTGELARQRAIDVAREANRAHHHHRHIQRPAATSVGLRISLPSGSAISSRRADVGIRARIGLSLIRVGMRFIDPAADLRQAGSPR